MYSCSQLELGEDAPACREVPADEFTDSIVLASDTARLYVLFPWERRGVVAELDTAALPLGYRLPTRSEGRALTEAPFAWPERNDMRNICTDTTGACYTFRFGGGTVSKAGEKTTYRLVAVRTERTNIIKVDTTWLQPATK